MVIILTVPSSTLIILFDYKIEFGEADMGKSIYLSDSENDILWKILEKADESLVLNEEKDGYSVFDTFNINLEEMADFEFIQYKVNYKRELMESESADHFVKILKDWGTIINTELKTEIEDVFYSKFDRELTYFSN